MRCKGIRLVIFTALHSHGGLADESTARASALAQREPPAKLLCMTWPRGPCLMAKRAQCTTEESTATMFGRVLNLKVPGLQVPQARKFAIGDSPQLFDGPLLHQLPLREEQDLVCASTRAQTMCGKEHGALQRNCKSQPCGRWTGTSARRGASLCRVMSLCDRIKLLLQIRRVQRQARPTRASPFQSSTSCAPTRCAATAK